jgi:flagellin-like hook-associated protein FlgL
MSDITLSAGVRQNLLALQSTASLLATTQQDLATGKKVNSALDNPNNFFTSQSLNNRANDLNALLDSIGQAQQTVNTAESGITSLTNLVQSAKSIATQAQQATTGTVNFTSITGTAAIANDSTRIESATTIATAAPSFDASVQSTAKLTGAGIANLHDTDVLTFQFGGGTAVSATFTTATTVSGNSFHTAAQLQSLLSGAGGLGSGVTVGGGTDVVVTSNDVTSDLTIGGVGTAVSDAQTSNPTDFASVAHHQGDALTISDSGGHTANFYYVANAPGVGGQANGLFNTSGQLAAAISDPASNVHLDVPVGSAIDDSGNIQINSAASLTVGGVLGTKLGLNASLQTQTYNANFNATLSAVTPGNLTVQVGTNAAQTITFGSGNGQVNTKAELQTALAGLTDIGASLNSTGDIQFTPTSSAAVTVGGNPSTVTGLGLSLGITTPVGTVVSPNSARASFQAQYNDLLTQIDQLAADSSYHGINLLNGDNLKVVFNENSTSSLTIKGVKFDSAGLGLTAVSGNGFQDNNNIDTTLDTIQTALTTLRTQAANFGSTETTVEARQDFTKDLINTLQTGADNLVLADTNQEGANLLALQTRQQLSITSLSLASQADQAILKVL